VAKKGRGKSLAPLSKKAGEAKREEIKILKVALKGGNDKVKVK
jgi:hypothetical protein